MDENQLENEEFRKKIKEEKYPFDSTSTNIYLVIIPFGLFFISIIVYMFQQITSYELSIVLFALFFFTFITFISLVLNVKYLKDTNSLLKQKIDILLYELDILKEK